MKTYRWTIIVLYVRYIILSWRYSVLVYAILWIFCRFHLTHFWKIDPVAIVRTLLINLISQIFVPTKWNASLYRKKLFVENQYCKKKFFFLQIKFLFTNVEYLCYQSDETSKKRFLRTFLLGIEHIFIHSSSLYYFQKVKQ